MIVGRAQTIGSSPGENSHLLRKKPETGGIAGGFKGRKVSCCKCLPTWIRSGMRALNCQYLSGKKKDIAFKIVTTCSLGGAGLTGLIASLFYKDSIADAVAAFAVSFTAVSSAMGAFGWSAYALHGVVLNTYRAFHDKNYDIVRLEENQLLPDDDTEFPTALECASMQYTLCDPVFVVDYSHPISRAYAVAMIQKNTNFISGQPLRYEDIIEETKLTKDQIQVINTLKKNYAAWEKDPKSYSKSSFGGDPSTEFDN